jgi:hypothetical protein
MDIEGNRPSIKNIAKNKGGNIMAWILEKRNKRNERKFYIRDIREGRQIVIEVPDDVDRAFAERMLEQYKSRMKLENHGYDDAYASPIPERNNESRQA